MGIIFLRWRALRPSLLLHHCSKQKGDDHLPITYHYYRNADLSRLGNLCCLGFPTKNSRPGQKRVPFCPGSGNWDKKEPFVPVGVTNGDKRCYQRPHGWRTLLSRLVLPTGTKCPLFFLFLFSQFFSYFNYTFAFQLNLCIGIQCVWSPLIYTYI